MKNEFIISGELEFKDYLECYKNVSESKRQWALRLILFFGIAIIVTGIFSSEHQFKMNFIFYGIFLIIYSIGISPLIFRFRIYRNWNKNPQNQQTFKMKINSDGLTTGDNEENSVHAPWDSFTQFNETENLMLIFQTPKRPICFPKRLLSEENISKIRKTIEKSINKE